MSLIRSIIGISKPASQDLLEPAAVIELDEQELTLATGGWDHGHEDHHGRDHGEENHRHHDHGEEDHRHNKNRDCNCGCNN